MLHCLGKQSETTKFVSLCKEDRKKQGGILIQIKWFPSIQCLYPTWACMEFESSVLNTKGIISFFISSVGVLARIIANLSSMNTVAWKHK